MNDHKHNKGLNFGGFSGYYGLMSTHNGYGGFNYIGDFEYMNASMWTNPNGYGYQNNWCDTGYQNVAAAAKTTSLGWIYQYGLMESANNHSFTLDSLLATVSFSANQQWEIISYADHHGSLVEKATMPVSLNYNEADTIKFTGKYAKGFSNIAAIAFEMVSYGTPGNTCTYGTAVYGAQMCIDNMKLKFAKKADLKHDSGRLLTPYEAHHHGTAAHVTAAGQMAHSHANLHAGAPDPAESHADGGYHSQLLSLGHESGLTGQFDLPAVEHLMT